MLELESLVSPVKFLGRLLLTVCGGPDGVHETDLASYCFLELMVCPCWKVLLAVGVTSGVWVWFCVLWICDGDLKFVEISLVVVEIGNDVEFAVISDDTDESTAHFGQPSGGRREDGEPGVRSFDLNPPCCCLALAKRLLSIFWISLFRATQKKVIHFTD